MKLKVSKLKISRKLLELGVSITPRPQLHGKAVDVFLIEIS